MRTYSKFILTAFFRLAFFAVFSGGIGLTIQQLHYAITISEAGSLNRAAEVLYISQPSLTSSMQELEKELGITIFYRSGRGVSLTQDGAEFLLYARQVYNQYEALVEKYGNAQNVKKSSAFQPSITPLPSKPLLSLSKALTSPGMNLQSARLKRAM